MSIIQELELKENEKSQFAYSNQHTGEFKYDNKKYKFIFAYEISGEGTGSEWELENEEIEFDNQNGLQIRGHVKLKPSYFRRKGEIRIDHTDFQGSLISIPNENEWNDNFGPKLTFEDAELLQLIGFGNVDELKVNDTLSKSFKTTVSGFPRSSGILGISNLECANTDWKEAHFNLNTYDFDKLDEYLKNATDEYLMKLDDELSNESYDLDSDSASLSTIDSKFELLMKVKRIK